MKNTNPNRLRLRGLHDRLTELQYQLTTCRTTAQLRCVEGAIFDCRRQMEEALS